MTSARTYVPEKPCKRGHRLRYAVGNGCVECRAAWRVANRDYVRKYSKVWYVANKEHRLEVGKVYDAANKERLRKMKSAWRVANNERWQKYRKAWEIANKDRRQKYIHSWYVAHKEATKSTRRETTKIWRAANAARVQKTQKAWRVLNRGHLKAWYAANRERTRERRQETTRAWRTANSSRYAETQRAWSKAHPEVFRAAASIRRARKLRATPKWSTVAHKKQMIEIYRRAVHLTFLTGIEHHVDHIIPLRGKNVCGLHVLSNLRIVTAKINRQKYNRFTEVEEITNESEKPPDEALLKRAQELLRGGKASDV